MEEGENLRRQLADHEEKIAKLRSKLRKRQKKQEKGKQDGITSVDKPDNQAGGNFSRSFAYVKCL